MGSLGPRHVENERQASGPCSKGARSASLRSDVREVRYRMEKDKVARWQRKMRDSQGHRCLRNEDFRTRVGEGFKKNWQVTLHFHMRLLSFT